MDTPLSIFGLTYPPSLPLPLSRRIPLENRAISQIHPPPPHFSDALHLHLATWQRPIGQPPLRSLPRPTGRRHVSPAPPSSAPIRRRPAQPIWSPRRAVPGPDHAAAGRSSRPKPPARSSLGSGERRRPMRCRPDAAPRRARRLQASAAARRSSTAARCRPSLPNPAPPENHIGGRHRPWRSACRRLTSSSPEMEPRSQIRPPPLRIRRLRAHSRPLRCSPHR